MPQDILDIYTDYLICQNQHATAIGLSNLLEGEVSHDQITSSPYARMAFSRKIFNSRKAI